MIITAGPAIRGVSSAAVSVGVEMATAAGHFASSKLVSCQPTGSMRASVNSIRPDPALPLPSAGSVSGSHGLP